MLPVQTYAFVWHQEYAPVCWPRCIFLLMQSTVRFTNARGAHNFYVTPVQFDQFVVVVLINRLAPKATTTKHFHDCLSIALKHEDELGVMGKRRCDSSRSCFTTNEKSFDHVLLPRRPACLPHANTFLVNLMEARKRDGRGQRED